MGLMKDILVSMRPRQWTKNLIVFAPAIFAGRMLEPSSAARVGTTFVLFCAWSGAAYLVNDAHDARVDRLYPRTAGRPIAAGRLSTRTAVVAGVIINALALGVAWRLSLPLVVIGAAFLLLQVAYTFVLRRVVLADVLVIVAAFLLRAVAGATVISVAQSRWLLACAAGLVLFLALAKRRQELVTSEAEAKLHRPVLERYSLRFLDIVIVLVVLATVASYAAYTVIVSGGQGHGAMVLTVPLVVVGLARYLFLVYSAEECHAGEEALLTDVPLVVVVLIWLAAVASVLYFR